MLLENHGNYLSHVETIVLSEHVEDSQQEDALGTLEFETGRADSKESHSTQHNDCSYLKLQQDFPLRMRSTNTPRVPEPY